MKLSWVVGLLGIGVSSAALLLTEDHAITLIFLWTVACVLGIAVSAFRVTGRPKLLLGSLAIVGSLMITGSAVRVLHGESIGIEQPFPSYADLLHVPGYLLFLAVVLKVHLGLARTRNVDAWLDACALTFAALLTLWVGFLSDFVTDEQTLSSETALSLFYTGVVFATAAVMLRISATPGERSASHHLLTVASVAFVFVDVSATVSNGLGAGLLLTTLLSPLVYGAVLAAAVHPSAAELGTPPRPEVEQIRSSHFVVLALAILVPSMVAIVPAPQSWLGRSVTVALALVTGICVFARVVRLLRSQKALAAMESRLSEFLRSLTAKGDVQELLDALPSGVVDVFGPEFSLDFADDRETIDHVALANPLARPGKQFVALDGGSFDVTRARLFESFIRDARTIALEKQSAAVLAKEHARAQTQATLEKSEKRFRALVQHASDAVLLTDANGIVTFASPSIEQMSGYPAEQYLSRTVAWAIHKNDYDLAAAAHQSILDGTPQAEAEVRLTDTSGDTHLLSCVLTNMLEVESVEGIVVNVSDMTDRRQLEATLRDAEIFDPLTLLFNRKAFTSEVDSAIRRSSVTHSHVQVAVINIDDFRVVNEGHGTQVGDQILVETAARIRQQLRIDDVIARLNGDEFGVLSLFDGPASDNSAAIERILSAVAQPMTIDGHTINIRATAGIAIDTDGSSTGVEMLRHADTAIDTAKESVRGSALVFEGSMGEAVSKRAKIRGRLSNAVDNDELRLVYQPIVNIETGEIVSLEALSRWTDPELGIIGPDVFIPIAERGGLIGKLGERVLRRACHQIAAWREMGFTGFAVSINLSAQQLHSPTLITDIEAALHESSVEPERLMIEITESMLIDDTDDAARQIRALRALGLKLAIDDFGTGYSSLSYLQRYDFDVLKVDRSFVTPIGDPKNTRERAIVRAMITLAQDLGATTVAEGIETEDELQALRELDCDNAQGFLLHRPLEVDIVTDVLRLSSQLTQN